MPIAGLLVPDASLLNIIFSPAPNLTYESHAMSLFFYFRWPSEVNEISRQLRLLNDIVMYLEDEGHQISNRIIVKMNIEVEVEKIIKKGHRSDLTPEVWAIGEKLNFDQLTTLVTLLLKKIGENGTSLALNEDNNVSYFSKYHYIINIILTVF